MSFLLEWSAKVALILGAAWVATLLGRRLSAATRYGIWAAAFAGIVIAPALTIVVPASPPPVVRKAMWVTTSSASVARVNSATQVPWVRVIWGAGCALSLLRLAAGFAWMRRRSRPLLDERIRNLVRKMCPSREVSLIATGRDTMPITWGLFPARIALPAGAEDWEEDRLYVVLAHELAHIQRGDWAWQIATEIVKAMYWFHPAVWFAARRLRQESEIACDDIVLNSGVPAALYASELLSLTNVLKRSGWIEAPALAMAKTSDLERRFTSMLNPLLNRRPVSGMARLFTFCATTALLVSLVALHAPAQNPAGVISGTVYDPTAAVVPNAMVTATNINTRVNEATSTHSDGTYTFKNLLPGRYQVTTVQKGFRQFDSPAVDLTGSQGGTVDVNLTIGQMSELITVTAQGVRSGRTRTNRGRSVCG